MIVLLLIAVVACLIVSVPAAIGWLFGHVWIGLGIGIGILLALAFVASFLVCGPQGDTIWDEWRRK